LNIKVGTKKVDGLQNSDNKNKNKDIDENFVK